MIFGIPLGAEGAPFWLKKASFLRFDFLMIFGVRDPSILGGVGGTGEAPVCETIAKKKTFL